jgi:hypothetical protein
MVHQYKSPLISGLFYARSGDGKSCATPTVSINRPMDTYLIEKDGRRRLAIELSCDSCSGTFLKRKDWVVEKNYCSRACTGKSQQKKEELVCTLCNDKFSRVPSRKKNSKSGLLFCSRKCKDIAQRIDSGYDDIHPEHYGSTNRYRDIAYRVFPRKCMACSFFDEYPELMQVHHIDSDRNNNDISNLAVLCPTHHWAITIRKATMGQDRIWHWVG